MVFKAARRSLGHLPRGNPCSAFTEAHGQCAPPQGLLLAPLLKVPSSQLGTFLVAQTVKRLPTVRETWVQSLGWEDLLEKGIPVFLPGKFHGQRSLVVYSPCGHKESDTTELSSVQFKLSCVID